MESEQKHADLLGIYTEKEKITSFWGFFVVVVFVCILCCFCIFQAWAYQQLAGTCQMAAVTPVETP